MARKSGNVASGTTVVKRGDVVWVPWRKFPLWPALVQNVYPKKVTYTFFPLPLESRPMPFSCHPRAVFALSVDDELPESADAQLGKAFQEASQYLAARRMRKNSDAPQRQKEVEKEGKGKKKREGEEVDAAEEKSDKRVASSRDSESPPTVSTASAEDELEVDVEEVQERAESSHPQIPSRSQNNTSLGEVAVALAEEAMQCLLARPSRRLSRYSLPSRDGLKFGIRTAGLLTDSETDAVVERVLSLARVQFPGKGTLPLLHLSTSVLLPAVIVHALQKTRGMTKNDAFLLLSSQRRPASLAPPTNGRPTPIGGSSQNHLETLVQIACQERDSLDVVS